MLDLCLAGTAGMVPLKDRWLTTLYASCGGHAVLIDAGEGTQIALSEAGLHVKQIDAILITHFHLDHIGGIAGLLLSMGNAGRTEDVNVVGPPGITQVLQHLLVVSPPPFRLLAFETEGSEEALLTAGEIEVRAFPAEHVIPCLGYTLTLPRKPKFDPEKARAQQVPVSAWSVLQNGEPVKIGDQIVSPEDVTDGPRSGLKVLYSTDTRPTKAIPAFGKNADLMILEGNYGENEKLEKAKGWGHMTFREAAALAKEANAKRLWLTHFSQAMKDPAAFLSNASDIFPNTEIGFDGKRLDLAFPEE